MTIIDGVRAWLKTYEGLADGRLSVDFLGKIRAKCVDRLIAGITQGRKLLNR